MSTLGKDYGSLTDPKFQPLYRAACHCGSVAYEVRAEPLDAKLCHCRDCQQLHGAPMQWAAIFHKHDVRLIAGESLLRFYHAPTETQERILPCKVSCSLCGTPIADEGRNMWLAFPTLFDFGEPPKIPATFRPSCHIFYGARVQDVEDGLPKWAGHKDRSERIQERTASMERRNIGE